MYSNECPKKITSKKRIKYQPSSWKVHRFQVQSGEVICTVEVLRMGGSLVVWAGTGAGGAAPGELALAVPRERGSDGDAAAACSLLGAYSADGVATALARRLALHLHCLVYVCCNEFDRFSLHVLEKGLFSEIKNEPDFFNTTISDVNSTY